MSLTMNTKSKATTQSSEGYQFHNHSSQRFGQPNMSATFEKNKPEMGAMDELQFNASLDALLDGENLGDGGPPGSNSTYGGVPGSITMHASGSGRQGGQPSQGLLTSSGTMGTSDGIHSGGRGMMMPLSDVSYGEAAPTTSMGYPGATSYGSLGSNHRSLLRATSTTESVASGETSSVISLTPSGRMRGPNTNASKQPRDVSAVSEDEGDHKRRKSDRNMREQQRSHKITEQIDHLKDVLAGANVQFKPDKYSTLVSVGDFIKDLQEKSSMLDVEHKKLLDTISRTNEMVNNQYVPASATGANPPGSADLDGASSKDGDTEGLFAANIDYRSVFSRCGVPLAVLSIDGRFLECNKGFEQLTGFSREELLPCESAEVVRDEVPSSSGISSEESGASVMRNLSLFNLLNRVHMEGVFTTMSEMLKHPPMNQDATAREEKGKDYWAGIVSLGRNAETKLHMNVSLVRSPQGRAKFFDCSMTPL